MDTTPSVTTNRTIATKQDVAHIAIQVIDLSASLCRNVFDFPTDVAQLDQTLEDLLAIRERILAYKEARAKENAPNPPF